MSIPNNIVVTWWRHQMETFSALLALCAENSPVTGEFPSQRPVTRSFDVFLDLRLNKRWSKRSRRRWFGTPSHSLWRHCNVNQNLRLTMFIKVSMIYSRYIAAQYKTYYFQFGIYRGKLWPWYIDSPLHTVTFGFVLQVVGEYQTTSRVDNVVRAYRVTSPERSTYNMAFIMEQRANDCFIVVGHCITATSYERHDVSDHLQFEGLSNSLFRPTIKEPFKLCITVPLWRELIAVQNGELCEKHFHAMT